MSAIARMALSSMEDETLREALASMVRVLRDRIARTKADLAAGREGEFYLDELEATLGKIRELGEDNLR